MGVSKKPKGVASNISSAANPAISSTTQTTNKSSILRSSFSPSRLQLSLFASVIQGFDSQHLRIHETTTGRLRCDYAIGSKASITCLDWGYHGANYQGRHHKESQKKRKRSSEQINGNGASSSESSLDAVVAFGTTDSEIHLFSPSESKVRKILGDAHTHDIRDFKFTDYGLLGEGWSIGGDGKIVQWDLKKGQVLRTVNLPHGPAHAIHPFASSVICASHNAYILDPESQKQPHTFTASTNTVHTIVTSTTRSSQPLRFLTAAEIDHFIPVFDAESPTLIGSLPTENEVLSLDLYSSPNHSKVMERGKELSERLSRPQEALLVVNKDGALEIFPEPFDFGNAPSKQDAETPKARAQRINRKRTALIRIRKDDKRSTVIPLVNACFQGNDIAVAWVEGGVDVIFDKVQWLDEASGNLILKNETDIMKAKHGPGVGGAVMNGVKDLGRSHMDESRVVIVNGGDVEDVPMADEPLEVIEISSGEESESADEAPARPLQGGKRVVEGDAEDRDVDMEDTEAQEVADQGSAADNEQPEAAEEPSFGDLIRANAPEAVDVQASFADPNAQSLVPTGERGLQQLPSGMSLGTVLTQSLRTNDTNLLETCFHVKDMQIVRATIERLDSSFATTLLQKLAERLHSRPGRAGSLMVWIQWTLVAHGGFLAGQPEIMKQLASLHRVVKDRANSLQSLLTLKGKLDMLDAQMNLRKSMQSRSRAANALEEDNEEGVIYVEGQDESASEGEEGTDDVATKARPLQAESQLPASASGDEDSSDAPSEDEESGDEKPNTANGIIADSEGEGSDSEDEGLLDGEASSTDHDSVDEGSGDDIDHESVDSVDSSDADASPPPKRSAKTKLSNGVGAARKR